MFLGKYFTSWMVMVHLQSVSVQAGVEDLNGLVRYYTGDNSLADASGVSSGTENDLTVKNGGTASYETVASTPFSSTSRAVFKFNGSSGGGYHLSAPADNLPLGNSARSMMGWVRIDQSAVDYWPILFGYGASGSNHLFIFGIQPDGTLHFDLWGNGDAGVAQLVDDHTPYNGTWKHYALTYDPPKIKFYVNGVLTKEGDLTESLDTLAGSTFQTGGNPYSPNGKFYGATAEIAIFSRALTQTEIVASTGTASGGGDPHFLGFGGVAFTWQGTCDSILTMTSSIRDIERNMHVHIRTKKVRKWSAIDLIAFKIGNEVGEIGSDEARLIHNGIEKEGINSDLLTVVKSFDKRRKKMIMYNIVFNKDKQLEVKVNLRYKMIYVSLSGNFPEETIGLLGSPHKPGLYSRNGTQMTEKEINKYSESWQVRDTDPQLFQQHKLPQYPEKCLYYLPKSASNTRSRRLLQRKTLTLEEATRACAAHSPGPLKTFCIEDVIGTADVDVAKDTFYG